MLKEVLKKNDWLLLIVSCIYNFPLKFFVLRKVKMSIRGAFIKHCKFKIRGRNNVIVIGEKGRLRNCTIYISGNNNLLRIGGGHTIVANTTFWLQGDNCTIYISEDFTMEGGEISVTENGKICIGKNCMFSFGIDIRNGDSHSILNLQGKRINKAQDIDIKDHVWLGANVTVLKGVSIGSHSIIGTRSVVSKSCQTDHSIYAGVPARFIKSGIDWNRKLID